MTTNTPPKGNIPSDNEQPTHQDSDSTNFWDEPIPQQILIGRQKELDKVIKCLAKDEDLWLIGAPGNGRRVLVYEAAKEIRAKILEIDCMKATSSGQLLQLMCRSLNQEAFRESDFQEFWAILAKLIQKMAAEVCAESFSIQAVPSSGTQLELAPSIMNESDPKLRQDKQKEAFERLINLLQQLAVSLDTRIIILFHSFEHIYSWDRQRTSKSQTRPDCDEQWEGFLRKEIARQDRVSYVLIGTGNPRKVQDKENPTEIVPLRPLDNDILKGWVRDFVFQCDKLTFSSDGKSLEKFLKAVEGHFGNARALAQRLILTCQLNNQNKERKESNIQANQVQQAIDSLLKDMSSVFESLLLSLPDSQLQILECLALDPTSNPHRQEYIDKHSLMKGGTLQGALKGLSEKGLIYDAQKDEYDYRLTFPLMALWICRRLT
jgi:DNA-binding MarR family transcriptional regulator